MSTCLASSTFSNAAALTVVVVLPVLFAGVLSASVLVAVAELVTAPGAVDETVTVTVAVTVGAIEPRLAVTVPFEPTGGVTSEPCDVVAETKFSDAGSTSVSTTPVAPVVTVTFFTVIV